MTGCLTHFDGANERRARARGADPGRSQTTRYFNAENLVGVRIELLIDAISGPPSSLLSRAAIQSGSAWNAANFFWRSSSESHFRM